MSLQGIKLVTFDVTNTLLKFRLPAWQYYARTAQAHGFTGTDEEVKTKFKNSFQSMWTEYPNFGKGTIEWEKWWLKVVTLTLKDHLPADVNLKSITDKLIEEFRTDKCWEIANGSNKLINHLKTLGISVGIISNFDPRLNDILQSVSLHSKFDFVLASYEIGYSKPDKRIFMSAINLCKKPLLPSEALHIGDDVKKDYEGARAAGWHALLINAKPESEKELVQEHVFKDFNELILKIQQDKLRL